MKFIMSLMLLSFSASAQQMNAVKTDRESSEFSFLGKNKVIISKSAFHDHEKASEFCKKHKLEIADPGSLLAILIAGANTKFIQDSLSFKVKRSEILISGMVGWLPKSEVKKGEVINVFSILDGRGTSVDYLNINDFKKVVGKGIPVTCTDMNDKAEEIEKETSEINSTDRAIVPEKEVTSKDKTIENPKAKKE